MGETIDLSISIPKTLFHKAETLAQVQNIPQSQLLERALEHFIKTHQQSITETIPEEEINQGDVYWVTLDDKIPHPHVIIQSDLLNHSRIHTVVACALTSNLKRANSPGNVLLEVDEANLSKQSVVEVSKVSTVDKAQLGDFVGTLSPQRINQILDGMQFLQSSFFNR